MGRTFDKSVLVGVGLLVALLVVNATVAYRNTQQLNEDAGWVAHTHEVLDLTSTCCGRWWTPRRGSGASSSPARRTSLSRTTRPSPGWTSRCGR